MNNSTLQQYNSILPSLNSRVVISEENVGAFKVTKEGNTGYPSQAPKIQYESNMAGGPGLGFSANTETNEVRYDVFLTPGASLTHRGIELRQSSSLAEDISQSTFEPSHLASYAESMELIKNKLNEASQTHWQTGRYGGMSAKGLNKEQAVSSMKAFNDFLPENGRFPVEDLEKRLSDLASNSSTPTYRG